MKQERLRVDSQHSPAFKLKEKKPQQTRSTIRRSKAQKDQGKRTTTQKPKQ
ncbi:hypothetical protein HYD93_01955 [Mycoplasmopsis bovis]|nr:hypothetical protein [Mycoplasmopsis bovis]QQH35182.1 hypothetical protein HYD93_01955 [Mycoplasmopsis bovis]